MPSFNSFILMSKQGKVRLAAYFKDNITDREKARDVRFIQNKVLDSSSRYSNIIEKGNEKLVFRRYASLFFIASVPLDMNELIVLEEIHLFVEVLDHYFGNVCELDIIFNFHKAYYILFEMFNGGMLGETSKLEALKHINESDRLIQEMTIVDGKDRSNEENGLSYAMQMHLGRRPTKKISQGGMSYDI